MPWRATPRFHDGVGKRVRALEFAAAIGTHDHRSARVILVSDELDFSLRAERRVREKMADREGRDEKILRVVNRRIS